MRMLTIFALTLVIAAEAAASDRAHGVDLSHFSGTVDWDRVAKGGR